MITTTVLLALFIIAGFVIGSYFCDYALLSKSYDGEPVDTAFKMDYSSFGYRHFDDIYRPSDDGLQLHAIKLMQESPSTKWAVVIHGYGSSAYQMLNFAQQYYYDGYNILLPDLRGHGMTEGNYIGMGWPDRLDMVAWAQYIVDNQPDAKILFHGISMGGATVMMLSGEPLPANVKCLVEDCGYSSVYDEFSAQGKEQFGVSFPFIDFASIVSKWKAGYSFKEASALEQLKKNVTPILFIHGEEDTYVPFEMVTKNYDATSAPKQLLTVAGAAHAESDNVDASLYWTTVFDFAGKYMD